MLRSEIEKKLEIKDKDDQVFITIDSLPLRYSINHKGLIRDEKLKRVILPYYSNNKLRYKINVNNVFIEFELNKLYLMAFSPMNTDLNSYLKILKINIYNKDILLPSVRNLIWIIPDGGIECLNIPGYYSIVGNPELVINKKYEFKNYHTRVDYKINIPSEDHRYPTIGAAYVNKKVYPFTTRVVHRLVMLAFYPVPCSRINLYVNHKSGDKRNFNIGNLEWITHKENNKHALENGFRNDNSPVIALSLETNEKLYFYSLQEASRSLGIHAWDISVSRKVFKESSYLKTYPWVFLFKDDEISKIINIKEKITQGSTPYFKLTKLETSEELYIRGSKNLDKFFKSKSISKKLKYEKDSIILKNFNIEKINRYKIPLEYFKKMNIGCYRGGKTQKRIRVTDLSNGSVITYDSTDDFATLVGAKRKSIQHTANLQNGVWRNFKIEYLN